MINKVQILDFTNASEEPERVIVKKCRWCDFESVIIMTFDQFNEWQNPEEHDSKMHAQNIFSHVSKESREILISGMHTECWNKMFGSNHQ